MSVLPYFNHPSPPFPLSMMTTLPRALILLVSSTLGLFQLSRVDVLIDCLGNVVGGGDTTLPRVTLRSAVLQPLVTHDTTQPRSRLIDPNPDCPVCPF